MLLLLEEVDDAIGDIMLLLVVVVLFLLLFDILKESNETKSLNKSLFFPFEEEVVVVVELLKVLFDFTGCIGVVLNKLLGCIGVELNKLLDCIVFVLLFVLVVEVAGGGLDINNENKSSLALFVLDEVVSAFGALWKDWKSAKSSILLLELVFASIIFKKNN